MQDYIIFIVLRMKAYVYSHTHLIGKTDLRAGKGGISVLYGDFCPNEYYLEHIRPVVRRIKGINQAGYDEWNALRLNVQLENGCFPIMCCLRRTIVFTPPTGLPSYTLHGMRKQMPGGRQPDFSTASKHSGNSKCTRMLLTMIHNLATLNFKQ